MRFVNRLKKEGLEYEKLRKIIRLFCLRPAEDASLIVIFFALKFSKLNTAQINPYEKPL